MKKRMDKYEYLDEEYENYETEELGLDFFLNDKYITKKQYLTIRDYNKYINKITRIYYIEEDPKYNFKITKNKALQISLRNNQLLYDYRKYTKNYEVEELEILEKYVDLVSINNKKYWLVQITKGILYGIENIVILDSFEDNDKYWKKQIDDNDKK